MQQIAVAGPAVFVTVKRAKRSGVYQLLEDGADGPAARATSSASKAGAACACTGGKGPRQHSTSTSADKALLPCDSLLLPISGVSTLALP